nr:MAG TPA: hypothetical protein [Caudoviricetes sp.]
MCLCGGKIVYNLANRNIMIAYIFKICNAT